MSAGMSAIRGEADSLCSMRVLSLVTQLYGPAVRCKLNLQMAVVGLALLYPALAWSRPLLAIMDIRARPISFSDRPWKASWVTRSRTRRRDRSPSPQIQLADLGGCLLLPSGALGLTEAIPSEPLSLARPDRRATVAEKGGGHPFGEPERAHIAATLRRASYSRCCTSTLHAMRANLLARAVASTLWCNR